MGEKGAHMIRKLLLVAAAVAMPVGMIAATADVAGATVIVVKTNTASCNAVAGTLTFSHFISTKGVSVAPGGSYTLKTKVVATLTKCTTNKAAMVITKGSVTGTISQTTHNTGTTTIKVATCTGLQGAQKITAPLTTKWVLNPTTQTVAPTVSHFNQFVGGTAVIGGIAYGTFTLPGAGGITSSTSTSSFQGTDLGHSNVTNARTVMTAGQLLTACNKSTGVPSLKITTNSTALPAATFA
jgi:hypothetical protein